PPAYSNEWGHIHDEQGGMGTNAQVADDGRVNIRIDQRSRKLSSFLVPALRHQLDHIREEGPPPPPYIPESLGGAPGTKLPPPLNIVIHVVGSRGDVQPFLALGKVLKESYKHRVRLATHPTFKNFVEENGLEFFSIGGDPSELMAFMVKNPGLMPGFDAIRKGDIGKRRQGIGEIIKGCWRSCFEIGDGMDQPADDMTLRYTGGQEIRTAYLHAGAGKPFIADAIIANPPSFAHIHCAERLGIPLHMMFTMPWSPTSSFPHPLANIQSSDADTTLTNFMSYALVDMLTWQGLGDIINRFRVHSLQLEPISLMWAPGMLARVRVPWTYCWSPALIPKPKDWASHISISGFYFLNLATNFTPAPDLLEYLQAGDPPVYIGFGSIVVDDPNALTKMIFEAVQKVGCRALVSKGWGGIGADELGIPEGVFMLGNVPHDWLFQHVSAVVHHGGAGTTAAGIAAGKPTMIVPFFGDQPFWGAMVARAGAGPKPIPYKVLTADNLAEAIRFCLKPESQVKAKEMAEQIRQEKGNEAGAESFHQMLPGGVEGMRCAILPDRAAVWRVKRSNVRLSALAACILAEEKILSFSDLKLFRSREYETDEGPWDPVTGGAGALIGTVGSMLMGVADMPIETLKALRIHPDAQKAKASPPKKPLSPGAQSSERTFSETSTVLTDITPVVSPTPITDPQDMNKLVVPEHSEQRSLSGVFSRHSRSGSGSSSRPGSRGESPVGRERSHSRSTSMKTWVNNENEHNKHVKLDTILGTGKGMQRIIGAGLKSPMDFSLALAKGFHNMPKLYGDDTVREVDKVTGVQSGIKTAAKEFGYGMYDGITGLVTQPYLGAKKKGAEGFVKGVGKGIAGLVTKPGAGIYGIPAYTMKGVYQEVQRHLGQSVNNYIIASRTAQGYEDFASITREERKEIVTRFLEYQSEMLKQRSVVEEHMDVMKEKWEQHRETRRIEKDAKKEKGKERLKEYTDGKDWAKDLHQLTHELAQNEADELEEAIRMSVQQTSRGDEDEDALIAKAIRASISALESDKRKSQDEDEALRSAVAASVAEASKHRPEGVDEDEYNRNLHEVLKKSVLEQR
ncbi:UDP-Glycosyltransferase/glycogen phosphorylase, partial [Rhizodiscina lignyota]